MHKTTLLAATIALTLVFGVSCSNEQQEQKDKEENVEGGSKPRSDFQIVDTLTGATQNTTYVILLSQANLVGTLAETENLTVFAPTEQAFQNLAEQQDITVEELTEKLGDDPELLKEILLAHVVEGKFSEKQLRKMDGEELTTLSGKKVRVRVSDDKVTIVVDNNNSFDIISADNTAKNGVVHTVNKIFVPR